MSNESVIGTTIPITPSEALNKSPAPAAEETAEQPAGEKEKVKKSVAAKKLEKRIMRLTGQAIADFNMIEEGDRIGVAVSGGKDSYVLLETLLKLQKRAPVHFEVMAVNIDMELPDFPHDLLPNYFRSTWNVRTPTRRSSASFRPDSTSAHSARAFAAAFSTPRRISWGSRKSRSVTRWMTS